MAHRVIYLPGLGDDETAWVQVYLLKKWQKFDLQPHFQPIHWSSSESFDSKLGRVLELIDGFASQKNRVSLIGVSAGASLALSAYRVRKDKISKAVFICGKINHPENISPIRFRKNPAFKKSMDSAQASLSGLSDEDKAKMLSVHPIVDGTVPVEDTIIPGVKTETILSFGHVPSILLALSLYKKTTIKFLKSPGSGA